MKKFLLLLIVFLALFSCSNDDPSSPEVKYGSLSGTVFKYGTDSVLAGVTVVLGNKSEVTDVAGKFLFSNLESGQKVTLTISKSGYQSTTYPATITADYQRNLSLCLLKYDCIPVAPQSDIDITVAATGNPSCFIPANTIVDENNNTPSSAVLNMTYAHNSDYQFNMANTDAYTADSAGTTVSLMPIAIVNFDFEESKGNLKFKTGKTASIAVELSKSSKSEVRLFYHTNGKFILSNDTLLYADGKLTAKVTTTGRWLFARVTENNLPQAFVSATPNNGTIETSFFFDARSSSDLDGDQLQARWCFNYQESQDSIAWNTNYSTDLTANWRYQSAGTYLVKVEIIDSKGGIAHAVVTVSAGNNLPQAVVTATPNNGTITTNFLLDARGSSDLDGDQLQARWCFDYQESQDSITWNTGYSTDLTANWQYQSAGTYLVKVEINDSKGGIAYAITEIMVTSGQSGDERVKIERDSSYTGNSWQETMKNTYHYNGNLGANFIGQVYYNGAYHDSLKGTVTYDVNNRPIHLEELHWDGTTFVSHSTVDRTYNSSGQLLKIISIDSEQGSPLWQKILYNYTGTVLDSAEFFNQPNKTEFKYQSYHFFYNADNRVSKAVVRNYYGSTTSQTEYRFFYNANGTIQMREHWSFMDNTYNKIAHTKFVYANSNLSYAETFQIINGSQEQLSERYEFSYSGNLLTNKKLLNNYTGALSVEQEHIYKYNSNGHLIHEQEKNPRYPMMDEIKAYSYENGLGNLSTLNADIEIAANLINPLNAIRPVPVK